MRRSYFYRAYAKELINYLNYLKYLNLTLGASPTQAPSERGKLLAAENRKKMRHVARSRARQYAHRAQPPAWKIQLICAFFDYYSVKLGTGKATCIPSQNLKFFPKLIESIRKYSKEKNCKS